MGPKPEFSKDPDGVRCIRCDETTERHRKLFWFHGNHSVAICPDCYEVAKERDGGFDG